MKMRKSFEEKALHGEAYMSWIIGLVIEMLSRCLSLSPLSPSKGDHLQCVFNGIGEVLQCADRYGLLRRVLAGAVGLCQIRDNHLHITLRTQGAWL